MTAPPAGVTCAAASGPGWGWMAPAAEMAATVCGGWLLAADLVPGLAPPGYMTSTRVATRTPGTGARSVRAVRDFTAATLRRWGVTGRQDDIVVVMSELLTNALCHTVPTTPGWRPAPVRIGLLQPGPCVLCAVSDPSQEVPAPAAPGYYGENGRGLHVVDSLSDGWGCTAPAAAGKIVWAVFATREPREALAQAQQVGAGRLRAS